MTKYHMTVKNKFHSWGKQHLWVRKSPRNNTAVNGSIPCTKMNWKTILRVSTRIKPENLVMTRIRIKDQKLNTKGRWFIVSAVTEAFGSISVDFVLRAAG